MNKLFRYLKPYIWAITAVLTLTFLQTMSELYLPTLQADIVDQGIVQGDTAFIWHIGGIMLLVTVAGAICIILASYLAAKVSSSFGRDLRTKVFTRVENFSLHEFDKFGAATLITRTTNDITQVQQVVMMILRMMLFAPLICVGSIIMAVSKDPKLSLVIVVVIPAIVATFLLVLSKGMPMFKAMQSKIDKLTRVVREGLTGIRVIRAFNRTGYENERFVAANKDLTDLAIRAGNVMSVMMPLMMLLFNFTGVAIIWFGGIRIDQGHMQVGDLMAFIQYVMQIMFSLMMLSFVFMMIPRASASAVRINEVLETEPQIKDALVVQPAGSSHGHVEFRQVTFRYPGAEQPAISNVSFRAEPGEVTAIIGGTGSGKSTLVSLIPRFYDVDNGCVLVDGVDVRELAQETLRAKIGYVSQTALLFSGSISDNIRYGKPDATEEELAHAVQIAQATEFVCSMENGVNAQIAQGGANISGGQKQRLTIARAVVRRPEIYIFDDNFSALDFKTDAKLRAALRKETANATVFIVAQRVSTVMDADRIIVLDDGRVTGMGTHQELLATCEVYREIVASQLGEEHIA